MAFNGSGTFVRLYSWTTEQLAGNPISSTKMDAEDAGFAAGLSNCITKDGQTTITNDIPMAGFKITGLGTPTATTDATTKAYVDAKTWATANIQDGAVTLAKQANLAQYRVNGRVSSGAGVPEALDADDIITILGQATTDLTLPVRVETDTYNLGTTSGSGFQLSTFGVLRVQRDSSALDTDPLFAGYRGTTLNAQIEANGDFQSATNSYGATSDRAAKREIADMTNTLDQLAALPMRKGKLNHEYARDGDAAPEREFVIADEVEAAGFGNLVKRNADGTQWVNYSGLYVKNIKATQELYAAHRALDQRVAALEGR